MITTDDMVKWWFPLNVTVKVEGLNDLNVYMAIMANEWFPLDEKVNVEGMKGLDTYNVVANWRFPFNNTNEVEGMKCLNMYNVMANWWFPLNIMVKVEGMKCIAHKRNYGQENDSHLILVQVEGAIQRVVTFNNKLRVVRYTNCYSS